MSEFEKVIVGIMKDESGKERILATIDKQNNHLIPLVVGIITEKNQLEEFENLKTLAINLAQQAGKEINFIEFIRGSIVETIKPSVK